MKHALHLLLALAFYIPTSANSSTFDECLNLSNSENKSYPTKLDELTTIINQTCIEEKNRVIISYRYLVDLDSKGIPKGKENEVFQKIKEYLKESVTKTFCTNKMFRAMLNEVDAKFEYFTHNKIEQFTTFTVTKSNCN